MYAIQTKFLSGWNYVGATDGERTLYDSETDAQSDLDDIVSDMHYYPEDWRVIQYVESEDSKEDL